MTNWDNRYRAGEHINDQPHPLITKFASKLSSGRALDIACGTGRHALWLAERGWRVTAVDSSPTAVQILQEHGRERAVHIDVRIADLERHEFTIARESYALVVV